VYVFQQLATTRMPTTVVCIIKRLTYIYFHNSICFHNSRMALLCCGSSVAASEIASKRPHRHKFHEDKTHRKENKSEANYKDIDWKESLDTQENMPSHGAHESAAKNKPSKHNANTEIVKFPKTVQFPTYTHKITRQRSISLDGEDMVGVCKKPMGMDPAARVGHVVEDYSVVHAKHKKGKKKAVRCLY